MISRCVINVNNAVRRDISLSTAPVVADPAQADGDELLDLFRLHSETVLVDIRQLTAWPIARRIDVDNKRQKMVSFMVSNALADL